MDKFEYKVRADEIKELISEGNYTEAAEIADSIDWRRVKSVMMLCMISDLYKINKRYEDAKELLLMAYDRRPGGRTICYSLCELCLKTQEFVQAVNYYNEFVRVAPADAGCYILKYKILEAQDAGLEERIQILQELKAADYREKWAYELAYLYHRIGNASQCVEECDELILWFGDGKYVYKAMELKMRHCPLTAAQQEKYDHRFDKPVKETVVEQKPESEGIGRVVTPQEGAVDIQASQAQGDFAQETSSVVEETRVLPNVVEETKVLPEIPVETEEIHVKTMDVGEYNTINLQAEVAAGIEAFLDKEKASRAMVASALEGEAVEVAGNESMPKQANISSTEAEEIESTEVFFGETGEISSVMPVTTQDICEITLPEEISEQVLIEETHVEETVIDEEAVGTALAEVAAAEQVAEASATEETITEEGSADEMIAEEMQETDVTAQLVMEQMRMEGAGEAVHQVMTAEPPKALAGVLSQEGDGQIRLIVPERESVEKQITGQMNIEDILAEWERMKQEKEEKHREEVRQHVLQQTGTMFTDFEASIRDGLLERLESGEVIDVDEELSSRGEIVEEPELEEIPVEIEKEPELGAIPAETAEEIEEEPELEAIPAETEKEPELEAIPVETAEEIEEEPELEAIPVETAEEIEEEAEPEENPVETAEEIKAEPEEIPAETAKETTEETESEEDAAKETSSKVRSLTREERELYAPFIQGKNARERLVQAIDAISLASYTGNIIITGEDGMDTMLLAKNMMREVQASDGNFSGKVAKVSGEGLNNRDVEETIKQLENGGLIIQAASGMSNETANKLGRLLQKDNFGIVVALEDTKKGISRLFASNPNLSTSFTARMDVEALSNASLAAFGKKYAREMEYAIDDVGMLALHMRIEALQTIDHAVTVMEVKEIVDGAIRSAKKKTLKHFVDILFAKRYDDEDMIILTERDFA